MKNKRTGIIRGIVILLLAATSGFSQEWIESGGKVFLYNDAYEVDIGTSTPGNYKLNVLQSTYLAAIYTKNTYPSQDNVVEINNYRHGVEAYIHGDNAMGVYGCGEATGSNQTVYGVCGIARPCNSTNYSGLNCYAGYFNSQELSSSGNFYSVYSLGDKSYFQGNVGVGTHTPSVKLDVAGTIKSTNPCAKGYRSANCAFGNGNGWHKIELDAELYDVGDDDFDPSTNYRFTAPTTGYYQVNASIQFFHLQTGNIIIACIRKNGSSYSYVRLGTTTTEMSVNVSDIIPLNKDDFVELWGYYSSPSSPGGSIAGNSLTTTYMSVRLTQ